MRIQVRGEGRNIHIPIPTGLIFSKPFVWLWLNIAKKTAHLNDKYIPDYVEGITVDFFSGISEKQMYALSAEIMRIKRKYGEWDLVEVIASSGAEVRITL